MFDFHMHIFKGEKPLTYFLNVGVDVPSSKIALLSEFSAIGIHPLNKGDISFIEKNAEKADAIGEIGLDFSQGKHSEEDFVKQLNIAEKYDLPVVIHSRMAEKECLDILKDYKIKVVLHSFGAPELIPLALKRGYFFSYSFFYSSRFKKMAQQIPLSRTIFETDYPYKAKTIEEAKNLIEKTAEKLSKYHKKEPKEILEIAEKNAFEILKKKRK